MAGSNNGVLARPAADPDRLALERLSAWHRDLLAQDAAPVVMISLGRADAAIHLHAPDNVSPAEIRLLLVDVLRGLE